MATILGKYLLPPPPPFGYEFTTAELSSCLSFDEFSNLWQEKFEDGRCIHTASKINVVSYINGGIYIEKQGAGYLWYQGLLNYSSLIVKLIVHTSNYTNFYIGDLYFYCAKNKQLSVSYNAVNDVTNDKSYIECKETGQKLKLTEKKVSMTLADGANTIEVKQTTNGNYATHMEIKQGNSGNVQCGILITYLKFFP